MSQVSPTSPSRDVSVAQANVFSACVRSGWWPRRILSYAAEVQTGKDLLNHVDDSRPYQCISSADKGSRYTTTIVYRYDKIAAGGTVRCGAVLLRTRRNARFCAGVYLLLETSPEGHGR
ncbi:hypothetical protein J6590_016318 [Homalodisca vitripennis]|nr:hypothetical protein J6590_016318 [Homalodisca vitripennis]